MTNEIKICPVCEVGRLVEIRFSDEFQYNGKTILVDGLKGYECPKCGADPVFPDQIRDNHQRIADAKRTSIGMLTGQEIKAFRKRFELTQGMAARLFGGGANAFSKYERGDVLQSESMDTLMWLVRRHPFLLEDLKQKAGLIEEISCTTMTDQDAQVVKERRAKGRPWGRLGRMRASAYECVYKKSVDAGSGMDIASNDMDISDESQSVTA